MTADIRHTDVAAYALGLLEEDDRRAFDAHLAHCALCSEELRDLGGLATLLREADPADDDREEGGGEADGRLVEMMRHRRTAQRRRHRRTAALGAAAAIALVAGGATVGAVTTGQGRTAEHVHQQMAHDHQNLAADLLASGETHSAVDARTGVKGTVATENKKWGTNVALDLAGVRGPLTCRLVAVTRTGNRHAVTEWAVPPRGYGVPGAPEHLRVHGGTAVARADLARFDVVADDGRTLLTLRL
ncbi:anti-sigma U factor RsuA [Actinoallomurus vinaceus]|uniref:Anti-sigma U factor RsuA n=1 Tax=Actinoallomurus vinaceus TaxID=1080074 RepID=A0ABP8USM8_9ACTN